MVYLTDFTYANEQVSMGDPILVECQSVLTNGIPNFAHSIHKMLNEPPEGANFHYMNMLGRLFRYIHWNIRVLGMNLVGNFLVEYNGELQYVPCSWVETLEPCEG